MIKDDGWQTSLSRIFRARGLLLWSWRIIGWNSKISLTSCSLRAFCSLVLLFDYINPGIRWKCEADSEKESEVNWKKEEKLRKQLVLYHRETEIDSVIRLHTSQSVMAQTFLTTIFFSAKPLILTFEVLQLSISKLGLPGPVSSSIIYFSCKELY